MCSTLIFFWEDVSPSKSIIEFFHIPLHTASIAKKIMIMTTLNTFETLTYIRSFSRTSHHFYCTSRFHPSLFWNTEITETPILTTIISTFFTLIFSSSCPHTCHWWALKRSRHAYSSCNTLPTGSLRSFTKCIHFAHDQNKFAFHLWSSSIRQYRVRLSESKSLLSYVNLSVFTRYESWTKLIIDIYPKYQDSFRHDDHRVVVIKLWPLTCNLLISNFIFPD